MVALALIGIVDFRIDIVERGTPLVSGDQVVAFVGFLGVLLQVHQVVAHDQGSILLNLGLVLGKLQGKIAALFPVHNLELLFADLLLDV